MIKYEEYKKIKEYREIGLTQRKVAEKLVMRPATVNKYWHISEAQFFDLEMQNCCVIDKHRDFLIQIIKTYPQIKETNVYGKLKENYPDCGVTQYAFYRYMKKLRQEVGLVKKAVREYMTVQQKFPGEESQADFGQYIMNDIYGARVKVYFFSMILSYSCQMFVSFSDKPFTIIKLIEAHEKAFKYFNGRTKTIMYDQDKLFVVSENAGNIVFTREFEFYVKNTGFSIYLCKKRDPSTKGKVENSIKRVKESFLTGREYAGINALNSLAMEWLDREANAKPNRHLMKSPCILYEEEVKHLIKVKPYKHSDMQVASVMRANSIMYKNNQYSIPKGMYKLSDKVRVEEEDGIVKIIDLLSSKVITTHKLLAGKGQISSYEFQPSEILITELLSVIIELLENNTIGLSFIAAVKKDKPRYALEQLRMLKKILERYAKNDIIGGMEFCLERKLFCVTELLVWLVAKFGIESGKEIYHMRVRRLYIERAVRLKEELYGRD